MSTQRFQLELGQLGIVGRLDICLQHEKCRFLGAQLRVSDPVNRFEAQSGGGRRQERRSIEAEADIAVMLLIVCRYSLAARRACGRGEAPATREYPLPGLRVSK